MARVLIVDPEPDLRLLAAEAVAELGHEAIVLDEPAAWPEVDMLMIAPSEDMQRVVDEIRHVSPDLSVIVVSVEAPAEAALAVHPSGFLAKPYTLESLGNVIDRALAAKEAA